MKTKSADEILRDITWENGAAIRDNYGLKTQIIEAMKVYASQAIDRCEIVANTRVAEYRHDPPFALKVMESIRNVKSELK